MSTATSLSQSTAQLIEGKEVVRGLDPLSMINQQQAKNNLRQPEQILKQPSIDKNDIMEEFAQKDAQQKKISELNKKEEVKVQKMVLEKKSSENVMFEDDQSFTQINQADFSVPCEYTELTCVVKEVSKKDISMIGELKITNYKLIFTPNGYKPHQCARFAIPHGCILRLSENSNEHKTHCTLTILSKEDRTLKFRFENSPNQYKETLQLLKQYAFVPKLSEIYCYRTNMTGKVTWTKLKHKVWLDFERLGIPKNYKVYTKNALNQDFDYYICKQQKVEEIAAMEVFRRNGRIPSVCYAHFGPDGRPGTGCALWRSAEPTFALYQKGSVEDRAYILEMSKKLFQSPDLFPKPGDLQIYSARKEMSIDACKEIDAGFEHPSGYKSVKRSSYNLDLKKLSQAHAEMQNLSNNELLKNPSDIGIMKSVVKTEWLGYIGNTLQSAKQISRAIAKHQSNVLVYCPDGTCVTCMMTSLSQLFLDPYYRTFDGFKILIWKEWNYYLYNFCGKGLLVQLESQKIAQKKEAQIAAAQQQNNNGGFFGQGLTMLGLNTEILGHNLTSGFTDHKTESFTFIFFLDCVSQLIKQNPSKFEFTAGYPAFIATQLYSNRFFEFVQSAKANEQPVHKQMNGGKSVFDEQRSVFQNKCFMQGEAAKAHKTYLLQFNKLNVTVWNEYFARYAERTQDKKMQGQSKVFLHSKQKGIQNMNQQNTELLQQVIKNIQQVQQLRLGKNELIFNETFLKEQSEIEQKLSFYARDTIINAQNNNNNLSRKN